MAAVLLMLLAFAAQADQLGMQMPDFTVDTIDGGTFTLSETLAARDMVLINFWASWCGPCRMEFPYLEQAYEAYADRVEVIALSTEPNDTDEILNDYVAEQGMTFPVANGARLDFVGTFVTQGIPTSVVVDRFGTVCYVGVGAVTQQGAFERLFEAYLGDDYAESRLLEDIPSKQPDVAPSDAQALSDALNAEGAGISFSNDADPSVWPMLPEEIDGRTAVRTTNAGASGSVARLCARIDMEEDGALLFDARTDTAQLYDVLRVYVDGAKVRSLSGSADWSAYAVPLAAGAHEVAFDYLKRTAEGDGEDAVWLDEMRTATGAEAEAALAGGAAYPVSDEVSFRLADEGAKEIAFENADALLDEYFGDARYFVTSAGELEARLKADESVDPDEALLFVSADGTIEPLAESVDGDGYSIAFALDEGSMAGAYFYESVDDEAPLGVIAFDGEGVVDDFTQYVADSGFPSVSWSYVEAELTGGDGMATYTVRFADEDGNARGGAIVSFCTDETCTMVTADETGAATYQAEPYPYHVQIIRAPEGYVYEGGDIVMEEAGGDITLSVKTE